MDNKNKLSVSVLVVTRNRRHDFLACLASISKQVRLPNEVVVVENNSKKTLQKEISDLSKSLSIKYLLEKRINIAHARNTAIKNSSGDILAFIDDDCVIPKTWVNYIFKSYIKNDNVGGIIGISLNKNKSNYIAQLEQILYITWLSQYFSLDTATYIDSGMFINTRNFSIKRKLLEKYKIFFNPGVPHKIEDTEFGLRLISTLDPGKEQVIFEPKLVVFHKNSTNAWQFMRRRRISKIGTIWLNKKYPDFEKSVNKMNSHAFSKLQDRSLSVKVLFFMERQIARLETVSKWVSNREIN